MRTAVAGKLGSPLIERGPVNCSLGLSTRPRPASDGCVKLRSMRRTGPFDNIATAPALLGGIQSKQR